MDKLSALAKLRKNLKKGLVSLGSWQQIPNQAISEILGSQGYEWIAIDLEHGSIGISQLPNLFLALESNNVLPFVRVSESNYINSHQALEAGAAGIIFPMVRDGKQLRTLIENSQLPPSGNRGVGFSRASLYGKNFEKYSEFAQKPFIVAMIESKEAIDNIEGILENDSLDAILVGPYDLSASLNDTGNFESLDFLNYMKKLDCACRKYSVPKGIHVVKPSKKQLKDYIDKSYQFIAFSTDALFLIEGSAKPFC